MYSLFDELVSIPTLLDHPHLSLEVALVSLTAHQEHDPRARRGRGGWRTIDRELRVVVDRHRFDHTGDLARLLPADLPEVFTTADLARLAGIHRDQAQKMAYCLRPLGLLVEQGRTRHGIEYSRPG